MSDVEVVGLEDDAFSESGDAEVAVVSFPGIEPDDSIVAFSNSWRRRRPLKGPMPRSFPSHESSFLRGGSRLTATIALGLSTGGMLSPRCASLLGDLPTGVLSLSGDSISCCSDNFGGSCLRFLCSSTSRLPRAVARASSDGFCLRECLNGLGPRSSTKGRGMFVAESMGLVSKKMGVE